MSYRLEYTKYEGGKWHELFTDKGPKKIIAELKRFNRGKGKGRPFSHSYLHTGNGIIEVHSVKFPSNFFTCGATFCPCHPNALPTVWDSYFGDFRPGINHG